MCNRRPVFNPGDAMIHEHSILNTQFVLYTARIVECIHTSQTLHMLLLLVLDHIRIYMPIMILPIQWYAPIKIIGIKIIVPIKIKSEKSLRLMVHISKTLTKSLR
jgi:hypothetical protein